MLWIPGPCVIETPEFTYSVAETLAGLARRLDVPLIFKASFDKANRSSGKSFRGPGLDDGLKVLAEVKRRCEREDLAVLGLRFKGDRFVPGERFEFLREQLGPAFVAVELDDSAANPEATMKPHSVLTEHLIDEPGQPTRAALDQVLELFRGRLLA